MSRVRPTDWLESAVAVRYVCSALGRGGGQCKITWRSITLSITLYISSLYFFARVTDFRGNILNCKGLLDDLQYHQNLSPML